ncbi:cytochrome P450 [Daedaleopsis nitida]|nr:cytochrome P450 [Daedaleopsis nitida]
MVDYQQLLYGFLAGLVLVLIYRWRSNPLYSIPTVGGLDWPFLSYLASRNFARYPKELLDEGHKKFRGAPFKVALPNEWIVVVGNPKAIDDLRKRPDHALSFDAAVEDAFQLDHTLGKEIRADRYHVDIIRDKLTRSLPVVMPDVVDELAVGIPGYITTHGSEWTTVNTLSTMRKIVARASNRIFIGAPLCRNQEYLDLAISFAMDVVRDVNSFRHYPSLIRSFVASISSRGRVHRNIGRAVEIMKPALDDRRARIMAEEDDDVKPKDMLQWIFEQAIPRQQSDESVMKRILITNFAAIHTTTNTLVNTLYDLASTLECVEPLREEIESTIASEGWTKASMGKMWKLDSFLKESQRYTGLGLFSVTRKALMDVTLNDGTVIPKGTLVTAASQSIHHDDAYYDAPDVFDPFRFARMREVDGEGTKHQFVNTSLEYISFGHGRHACPGRFFAANELKAILAFIILNYDVKLTDKGRLKNLTVGASLVPDPMGEIMFRKRQ